MPLPLSAVLKMFPTTAITMGVATIMGAREVAVLMAWGEKKASIVKKAVQGPVTVDERRRPTFQKHPNAGFLLDKGAASLLLILRFSNGNAVFPGFVGRRRCSWDEGRQKLLFSMEVIWEMPPMQAKGRGGGWAGRILYHRMLIHTSAQRTFQTINMYWRALDGIRHFYWR